jgi:hypothetical protein
MDLACVFKVDPFPNEESPEGPSRGRVPEISGTWGTNSSMFEVAMLGLVVWIAGIVVVLTFLAGAQRLRDRDGS